MTKPAVPPTPQPTMPAGIDPAVLHGIRRAARDTGIDFGFLMAQAAQESGFRADARAATSSATGLYQFIESTWLQMMRDHGAKYGQGALAARIETGPDGQARVPAAALRERILELRNDPRLSAALGAEYARANRDHLEQALGRPAAPADLYLAHFLGPAGAVEFLKAMQADAGQPAAAVLPRAAAANGAVFHEAETGRARSLGEVYRRFERRIAENSRAFGGLADGGEAVLQASSRESGTGAGYRPLPAAGAWLTPSVSMVSLLALTAWELPPPKSAKRS